MSSGLDPVGVSAAEQLRILPGRDPRDVLAEAHQHGPFPFPRVVALFSGGHDSCVLAHYCHTMYDQLAYIDTGTAVPGVREFVESYAAWLDKPLRILEAGSAYRDMVLKAGFPGPAQHRIAYINLKERQLRRLKADLKVGAPRSARVLYLTGVRRAESARRSSRPAVTRDGATVFASPLIDWTDKQMRDYRDEHDLPESDVAALIHRSGECNCGCYAQPGEREMLRDLWPEWFDATIGSLEREAADAGLSACKWGQRPPAAAVEGGPLCASCDYRQMRLEEAA